MKKVILIIGAMLLAASTGSLAADGKTYVGASAGLFMVNESTLTDNAGYTAKATFDQGIVVRGFGGYAFGAGTRVEGELSYGNTNIDKIKSTSGTSVKINSELWAISLMANVYYDIKTQSIVTPYIGGGIGFSNVNAERGTANGTTVWRSDSDTVLAYQIGAGAGFEVNKNVTIDVGYRYFGTQDVHFDLLDAQFTSHNVTVGVRNMF